MTRIKVDYGIDLGTTNSAIARMEHGEPHIIKVDLSMDTLPSCVAFSRNRENKILEDVGIKALNRMDSSLQNAISKNEEIVPCGFLEFKRKMGTAELLPENWSEDCPVPRQFTPEELSAEVLKKLKSFVQDEEVRSIIITVPAKFTQNQKDATMRAAQLAGFEYTQLLQEPVAAAMAYGVSSSDKDGLWLVFDFGGGTFDAALVRPEDGILIPFDTAGDNYLGGKNLDEAVVNEILLPHLRAEYNIDFPHKWQLSNLKTLLKRPAEEIRIALSRDPSFSYSTWDTPKNFGTDADGQKIEIEIEVSKEELEQIIAPYYQKAVDTCKELLHRNNLRGEQLTKVILVGGPTHSPIVRKMLREQITLNVDTSVDPMTVVATGAALYASTIDNNIEVRTSSGTIKLNTEYDATTVEDVEYVTVKLDDPTMSKVTVEMIRGDKAWASGRHEITSDGDVIEVDLLPGRPNLFNIQAYDNLGNSLPCFPNEITIIQGTKVRNAPLAYNVGVEIWDYSKKMGVFQHLNGLEKNRPTPAVGTSDGLHLKTTSDIRPGNNNDFIQIPIYEAEYDSDGERAALFNHTYTLRITGENVPQLIPNGSELELALKCADSGWELSVYFPCIDYTTELTVPRNTKQDVTNAYLEAEILKGESTLKKLLRDGSEIGDAEQSLDTVRQELMTGAEKHQVLTHLREALRKIDKHAADAEWPTTEKKLNIAINMLEEDNQKYGNAETSRRVADLRAQVNQVLGTRNIPLAKDLLKAMHDLNFQLARVEYFISWIMQWNDQFNNIHWSNRIRARELLNQGIARITGSPSADTLEPIVHELINLLPAHDIPPGADGLVTQ